MSTTREEVLAALTENEDGLTSKEMAPLCPACECDPQVVASVVAMLRNEEKIHPVGLREGGTVYKIGPPPRSIEHKPERPVPLHAPKPPPSEAARAIAALRQPKTAAERAPDRAPSMPATTPAPVSAAAPQENSMAKTIQEKIEKCLQEHGPLDSRSIRKKGLREETLSIHLADLSDRKVLVRLGGGPRSTIYGLPGQKLPKPDALESGAELGRKADKGAPPQRHPKPAKKAKATVTPEKGRGRKAVHRKPSRNGGDSERAPVPAGPAAPPAANGAAAFAINHHGELGIEKEGTKLSLSGAEFVELREFISRTQPVWKGASA